MKKWQNTTAKTKHILQIVGSVKNGFVLFFSALLLVFTYFYCNDIVFSVGCYRTDGKFRYL